MKAIKAGFRESRASLSDVTAMNQVIDWRIGRLERGFIELCFNRMNVLCLFKAFTQFVSIGGISSS